MEKGETFGVERNGRRELMWLRRQGGAAPHLGVILAQLIS